MSAFDPIPQKGIPYHLRPSTPEELATHRRLLAKTEALRRKIVASGGVLGGKPAAKTDGRSSGAAA